VRKGVVFGTIASAAMLMGIALIFKSPKGSPEPATAAPTASLPEFKTRPSFKPAIARHDFAPVSTPVTPFETGTIIQREPRQIVAELTGLSGTRDPVTREQAEAFKQNLDELVRQGVSSVPAIREFLAKNLDCNYAGLNGGDQLGYSSLRAALFDTLKQIGGSEAQAAMLQTIQTTAVPAEILELAKNLEQEAPGLYRDQILNAAHEALDMASANQLGSNVELGPVFHVLQTYGGDSHPSTKLSAAGGTNP